MDGGMDGIGAERASLGKRSNTNTMAGFLSVGSWAGAVPTRASPLHSHHLCGPGPSLAATLVPNHASRGSGGSCGGSGPPLTLQGH